MSYLSGRMYVRNNLAGVTVFVGLLTVKLLSLSTVVKLYHICVFVEEHDLHDRFAVVDSQVLLPEHPPLVSVIPTENEFRWSLGNALVSATTAEDKNTIFVIERYNYMVYSGCVSNHVGWL